jgi:purine-binding chemotaxis protein CheW
MDGKRIDWDAIHSRVEAASRAIARRGYEPSPVEKRRILKKRAALLAREKEIVVDEDSFEVVEFLLAKERYGIESQFIREVYPLKDYTHLPGVPPFVLGLVNIRGQLLSVLDIKKFFDIPEQGINDLNKVIIIKNDNMEFGILADAIVGVRTIAARELGPPLPTLTGIREEFLKGVTDERMVILDAARILSDKNIVVHDEV